MKTRAAVVVEVGQPFQIVELELDDPVDGEVLVRYTHAGLCHSDLHVLDGSFPARLPIVAGHEGAGVVEAVGPGVTRVKPGDHFVASFIPVCGTCHWCATGRQSLCDWGATILEGYLPGERFPFTGPLGQYGAMAMLGTFSQYATVHENSLVKIDDDLPLERAVLVSCGVPTGWGAAVNAAAVKPGETVIVYGVGGIGANAVQGSSHAGASNLIAVDPQPERLEQAGRFGATHAVSTGAEATELALELTRGVGADKAIVAAGTVDAQLMADAFTAIGKGGVVVVVGMGPLDEPTVQLPSAVFALYRKTIRGTLFGDCNPTTDIPRLLDLYRSGTLQLDALVSREYALEEVNDGYADLQAGRNLRGIIVHQH